VLKIKKVKVILKFHYNVDTIILLCAINLKETIIYTLTKYNFYAAQAEYELLLEDEVEFVQALQMPGDRKERKPMITATERKLTSIEETQKSLPIYPFKKELIEAIKNHQVLDGLELF
jgi:HrpA-like RNA helicase